MVTSLFRGYFTKETAWRIALEGCILFFSDMVVAFAILHPVYREFLLWKENLIWGTYMIGRMLLSVSAEDRPLEQQG